MPNYNCKMCGGTIKYNAGDRVVTCEYCGSTQTISNITDDRKINLFNRANSLRLKNEFDKALATYETILLEFPNDAEAHWGLCLCKYGIEYVNDPKTGKKIPTCHRTLFQSIFDDLDYKEAINNSDVIAKEIYEAEAKTIDQIQKRIIETSQKEEPYDIFICYKESDESNQRTKDSVLAQDIYSKLTANGYKVFFSRITLEKKLGVEYEPIIFAALRSSKIMLSIGSKSDYFNSPWVKNEWSRFLSFMKDDSDKYLIPCYIDMDPYDLPEEFMMLQAQDMGKIGFIQDLIYGIDKLLKNNVKQIKSNENISHANSHIDNIIERIELCLEDDDYSQASKLVEDVLNEDAECSYAYLYRIVIDKKLTSLDDLCDLTEPLTNNRNYVKALRFAKDYELDQIRQYNNAILQGIEEEKKLKQFLETDKEYQEIVERLDNIFELPLDEFIPSSYTEDINNLRKLGSFKDSAELADEYDKKISDFIAFRGIEKEYQEIVKRLDNILELPVAFDKPIPSSYTEDINNLRKLGSYKDSAQLADEYEKKITDFIAYRRDELEKQIIRNKKINRIFFPIFSVVCALIVLTYVYFIPQSKYSKAISLINDGNYSDSARILAEISGYRDAKKLSNVLSINNFLSSGDYQTSVEEIIILGGSANITIDSNGGESTISNIVLDFSSDIPNCCTKLGYEFIDWELSTYSMKCSHNNYTINLTLKACYDIVSYHIKYDIDGGKCNDLVDKYYINTNDIILPTPVKEGYDFLGWYDQNNNKIEIIKKGSSSDLSLFARWEIKKYSVNFYNFDNTLLFSCVVGYGEDAIYGGLVPTRAATAQYTYTWNGWDKDFKNIQANTNVTALFTSKTNVYEVRFYNYDNSLLYKTNVEYGKSAIYKTTPQRPISSDDLYDYVFSKWSVDFSFVDKNLDVYAEYITINRYLVTFKNGNVILQQSRFNEGTLPTYNGEIPTKASTSSVEYSFVGWSPSLTYVTGDVTYVAQFDTLDKYWITFKNDGVELQRVQCTRGNIPTYTGATPTKASTYKYNYVFSGWSPSLVAASGNATYVAVFTSEVRKYTVTYKNYDGSQLSMDTVACESKSTYSGATPTKPSDSEYSYTFVGWDIELNSITENVVATAQFSKTTLGIVYTLSEYVGGEKCYYATEYNGTATELYIPDIYNGLPVRHVGAMTVQGNFTNNKNLTKIVLGANVKRIQSNTFANQTKLVELQLNNSLVAIGSSAFSNCMKLEYVFIPKSVTNIGSRAFYKTGTTLVLHILSDIDLTDGWPTYWDYDFYNSSEFPSILLTGVDSNKPLNYYGEFVYTYKNGNLILVGYSGGNEVVIPEEIEGQNIYSLGVAFWYNRKITKITINASLYEIGEGALRTTTSLVECVINKPITKNITEYDFANSGIKRFVINANQVSILGQIYHSGDILNIN